VNKTGHDRFKKVFLFIEDPDGDHHRRPDWTNSGVPGIDGAPDPVSVVDIGYHVTDLPNLHCHRFPTDWLDPAVDNSGFQTDDLPMVNRCRDYNYAPFGFRKAFQPGLERRDHGYYNPDDQLRPLNYRYWAGC
jgi:hypothetical protein